MSNLDSYHAGKAVSESQRQVDKKNNNTASGHRQADIDHYTRLLTAGHKWGIKNGAHQALINLGQNPQALGGEV
jgi:hypothetical protein